MSAPVVRPLDDAWVCLTCRQRNAFALDACTNCGTPFGAQLRDEPLLVSPRLRAAAAGARELALLLALFVLWKLASDVSVMQHSGAFARARWVWRLERTLHLPSEVALQHGVLPHHLLVQTLDVFYLAAHIGSLLVVLPWLFFRHREHYRHWRNTIVAFTGCALLLQLVSVAPPRLLPQYGFVDTAALYHQSPYGAFGSGLVDQLSSMPSIHVGWSLIVALAVIKLCRSRWRWLIVVHPVLTTYVVVATANHFWLDGVAAVLLVAAVLGVQQLRARRRGLVSRAADRRRSMYW